MAARRSVFPPRLPWHGNRRHALGLIDLCPMTVLGEAMDVIFRFEISASHTRYMVLFSRYVSTVDSEIV